VTGEEPPRVLLLARELGFGGIQRDISKFVRHLPQQNIAPHVACFRPGGVRWDEIVAAGVPTVHLPITSFKSRSVLSGAAVLKRYIAEHRIDLLHAFDAPTDLFATSFGRLTGIPVIASNLWLRSMLEIRLQWLLAVTDHLATGVFVNCEAVARELVDRWRVPRAKVHVCYNGFEPAEFEPAGRERRPEFAKASLVVGTVAVLRPEKNLILLIEAFAHLLETQPRAILLIVGSGPEKAALVSRASALGIADACVFQEAVAAPAEWFRTIDVFVLSSDSEAFSNALLEAMACGCCPVGTDVGGTPELIEHGTRGLLFPVNGTAELVSALGRLANDPAERIRMGEAAAAFAHQRLTVSVATSRLASIYRQVLGRSSEREAVPC